MPLVTAPIEPALAKDGLSLLHNPMPNIGSGLGSTLSVANENVWVEAVASTSDDTQYISFSLRESHSTGGMVTGMVDIGVGAASSEVIIAKELLVQKINTDGGVNVVEYRLPLTISSGSRVAVRYNTLYGTRGDPIYFVLHLYGSSSVLSTYSYCDLIGRGTSVATTANTKSAWVELSASTSYDYDEVIVGHVNPTAANLDNSYQFIDLGVGAASSEVVVLGDLMTFTHPDDDILCPTASPRMPLSIPSGSRVAARVLNNDTGANSTTTLCAWGFRT